MIHLPAIAKTLRKNMTDSERLLWSRLRAKQLASLKFRRQEPIERYIVDFVCYEKKLIIEVDGGQHAEEKNEENDNTRDLWFQQQGFQVLRFWSNEVLNNIEGVLEIILKNITPSCSPPSIPPIKGGKKIEDPSHKEKEED